MKIGVNSIHGPHGLAPLAKKQLIAPVNSSPLSVTLAKSEIPLPDRVGTAGRELTVCRSVTALRDSITPPARSVNTLRHHWQTGATFELI